MFNELLVTMYLYMYLLLTDFTFGNDWAQDEVGLAMLGIIFLSIGVNTLYMTINMAIMTRKKFLRWWWFERKCCRNKI